ncbi:26242_t:CDS:2, partial [Racocetra persica]
DDEDLDDIIEVPRIDADERDWDNGRDADLEVDDMHAYSQEADNRIKDKLVGHSRGREKAEQITVDIFLLAMSKIEMKMERNFSALHREIEECDLLNKAWPKVSLSKPHDQHEYDFLAKIGKHLDKAIKVVPTANKKDFDGVRDEIEARTATLSQNKSSKSYRHKRKRYSSPSSDSERDESHKGKRRYDMIEAFNSFVTEEPLGFQNVKESLTASSVSMYL